MAGVASILGMVVLHAHLPHPQHFFADDSDSQYEDHHCPAYGCPIYPLEKDDELVLEALQTRGGRLASPSSYKHIPPFARSVGTTVTYQGNDHPFNQDRAFIIRPYHTHQTANLNQTESFLLAILDGHGLDGHIVAEYVSKELPRLLASKLNNLPPGQQNEEWIKQQLIDTFIGVDKEAPPNALRGGCTASVTLRIGSKLYFANAGDSRSLLVAVPREAKFIDMAAEGSEQVKIVYETRRDKPHLPDERARIEGLGGTIHIPPSDPNGSRVVVYSASAIPPEPIGLAMSRSIGDWEWKEVGVTAEPIVDVVDLLSMPKDHMTYILAATDGLFDLRRDIFYAKQFAQSFLKNGDDMPPLLKNCVDTINFVSPQNKLWYRDDITIILAPVT
jgi:serine/threonine protein phosphatase PrpC